MSLLLFYQGSGVTVKSLAGDVATSSSLVNSLLARARSVEGTSATSVTYSGDLLSQRLSLISGDLASSVTWTSDLSRVMGLVGAETTSSSLSALLNREKRFAGATTSSSALTGNVVRDRGVAALLSSTSSLSGNISRIKYILGQLSATSTRVGSMRVAMRPVSTPISATSVLSDALLEKTMRFVGSNPNTATLSANLYRERIIHLLGSLGVTAAISPALLEVARPIAGSSSSVADLAALLLNLRLLAGDSHTSGNYSTLPLLRLRGITGPLTAVSYLQVPGVTRLQDLLGSMDGAVALTSSLVRVRQVVGDLPASAGLVATTLDRVRNMPAALHSTSSLEALLGRDLATLSALSSSSAVLSANVGRARLFQGELDAFISQAVGRLTKLTPISGDLVSHSEMTSAVLNLVLGFIGQVGSTSSLSAALRKVAALNASLDGLAHISATTLRITDDLVSLTVKAAWQSWEKVDNSTAILVDHVTAPYTYPVRFDLDGQVIDELALSATLIEEQG